VRCLNQEIQTLHLKFQVGLRHTWNNWSLRVTLPTSNNNNNINYITDTLSGYCKVYPNPTTNQEYFAFKLPCSDAEGLLVVADMTGNSMFSSVINSATSFVTINTRSWSNGNYLYRLTCNNKVVGSGKFEVVK
jgi:hypothetical protein